MPSCVMKNCTNYDAKFLKKNGGISYHRFPTNPVRNEEWCRIIRIQRNQPEFKSNQYVRVCSAHFADEDYYYTETGLRKLKREAVPRLIKGMKAIKIEQEDTQEMEESLQDEDFPFPVSIVDVRSIIEPAEDTEVEESLEQRYVKSQKKIKSLEKQVRKLWKKNKSLLKIIEEFKQNS